MTAIQIGNGTITPEESMEQAEALIAAKAERIMRGRS